MREAPVIFLGVPIPEKQNPVIVLFTNSKIRVSGEIEYNLNKCSDMIRGNVSRGVKEYVGSFISRLSRELDMNACFNINIEVSDNLRHLISSIYVVATHILVEAILGKESMNMDPEDLAKALIVIDRSVDMRSQYIEALRFATALSKSLVFRRGDEFIKIRNPPIIERLDVKKIYRLKMIPDTYLGGELGDLLTKLVGYTLLKASQELIEESYDKFLETARLINRYWSLIHGLPMTNKHYIYDPQNRVALTDVKLLVNKPRS